MATTPIPKYRPYLSMAEIDAILELVRVAENVFETMSRCDEHVTSAAQALLKTKTLASLGLQKEAYKTNPRPSLTDRLGFGISGAAAEDVQPNNPAIPPDFNALMEELSTVIVIPSPGESNE